MHSNTQKQECGGRGGRVRVAGIPTQNTSDEKTISGSVVDLRLRLRRLNPSHVQFCLLDFGIRLMVLFCLC